LVEDIIKIYEKFGSNEFTFSQIKEFVGFDAKTFIKKNIFIKIKGGKCNHPFRYRLAPKYIILIKTGQQIPRPQSRV
jgi:hypothetical protein